MGPSGNYIHLLFMSDFIHIGDNALAIVGHVNHNDGFSTDTYSEFPRWVACPLHPDRTTLRNSYVENVGVYHLK